MDKKATWNKSKLEKQNVIVIFPEVKHYIMDEVLKKNSSSGQFLLYGLVIDRLTYHLRWRTVVL